MGVGTVHAAWHSTIYRQGARPHPSKILVLSTMCYRGTLYQRRFAMLPLVFSAPINNIIAILRLNLVDHVPEPSVNPLFVGTRDRTVETRPSPD